MASKKNTSISNSSFLKGIVILGILVVGVYVTNILLKNQQDLRQRAAGINGVIIGVSPRSGNMLIPEASQFEIDSGKSVAIINFWEQVDPAYPWGSYQAKTLNDINSHHSAIPMMSWEPAPWGKNTITSGSAYSLANFAKGDYDALIKSYAQGIKSYGKPVLVRWAHEMNGDWYSWGVGKKADGSTPNNNTAQQYIDVWKRVRNIFVQAGVTNAQFVWCPNVNDNGNRPFDQIFPGEDQIEWICLDGYNWNNPWLTFDQVYSASYNTITGLSQKPLMLGEFASNESGDDGTKKANWITNAFSSAIPSYPRIKAALWFNVFFDGANWPITSTTKAKDAFYEAMKNPYYFSSWDGTSPLGGGSVSPSVTPAQNPTNTPIPTAVPTSIPTLTIGAADTTSPSVSFKYPTQGSTVRTKKPISVQVTASDNVKVNNVIFYLNGSAYCSDNIAPYTCSMKLPLGNVSLSAKGFDTSGNNSSATITVVSK